MQIQDCTVVTDFMISAKQVGKICAPFLIGFLCRKVLLKFIFKYFMWFAMFILWLFQTDNGFQTKHGIHIFMYRWQAVYRSFPCQIHLHGPVAIYAMMIMVDFCDLCQYFFAFGIISCLSLPAVIIISIWADVEVPQEPTQSKLLMMLFDKPISL